MFDISWSELLILAVVTLIFVGPKELPAFLRTLGRYAGMVRRQAMEFRSHFDAAMREAELDAMKKDVEEAGRQASNVMRETMRGLPSDKDFAPPPAETPRTAANGFETPPASNENNPLAPGGPHPPAPVGSSANENAPKNGA